MSKKRLCFDNLRRISTQRGELFSVDKGFHLGGIVEFVNMVFSVGGGVLIVVMFIMNRNQQKKPVILQELADESGMTLHAGKSSVLQTTPLENPRVTGERNGRRVQAEIDFIEREAQEMQMTRHKKTLERRVVTAVKLPGEWRGISLWPDGFDQKIRDVDGADTPIGDEFFDSEFYLSGDPGPELQTLLKNDEIQRHLRDLGPEMVIDDGYLKFNELEVGHTSDDLLRLLDELGESVDWIEKRQREILEAETTEQSAVW